MNRENNDKFCNKKDPQSVGFYRLDDFGYTASQSIIRKKENSEFYLNLMDHHVPCGSLN